MPVLYTSTSAQVRASRLIVADPDAAAAQSIDRVSSSRAMSPWLTPW